MKMLRKSQSTLLTLTRQFQLITRGYVATKKKIAPGAMSLETETDDIHEQGPITAGYLTKTIGSALHKWQNVLQKHPYLRTVKSKDIDNTAKLLISLNYSVEDILSKPMILYTNSLTIGNRHSVLRECGFELITISLLSKYLTAMNKSVAFHKSNGYIKFSIDVIERLKKGFTDIEVTLPSDCSCTENMEVKLLRQQILNCYLRQRLDMSATEIEKLWKVYGRVRHKSFQSVQSMVRLLVEDLQFPKERIIKNAYLLYADADNVRRIVAELPTIDGQAVRDIVYGRPKILMSSFDALITTLKHIKDFDISENAVIRCLEVLTLGPDTVLERLRDINEIEEFKVLRTNPRVLRLVHYQNKARVRLEYLNQLKVRCASLHILSCSSEAFAKFARDGSDRTKGRDIVVFLGNIMEKDENDIRNRLTRHPNWCHIPVKQIKQCYDFLISKQFGVEDIFQNVHLLLYPIKRIDEKLTQLAAVDYLEGLQLHIRMHKLSNNEILTLVLYLIEYEFHFTGDGVWTEQHTQQVENFNNLLPDFPESLNKVYKYGVKPATSNRAGKITLQN